MSEVTKPGNDHALDTRQPVVPETIPEPLTKEERPARPWLRTPNPWANPACDPYNPANDWEGRN